jgi:Tol biopolymer transport system component
LKKVDLDGGPVETLCEVSGNQFGGTWGADGTILFSSNDTNGVQRVSADGGQPAQVTMLDASHHEDTHLWPDFLPDGHHFLFLALSRSEPSAIYVGSLDSRDPKRLLESDSMARYMEPNRVLSLRGDALVTQGFDVDQLALNGEPTVLVDSIARAGNGRLGVSASTVGTFAYVGGNAVANQFEIAMFDRSGKRLAPENSITVDTNSIVDQTVELAPSGQALAYLQSEGIRARDIWTIDLQRQIKSRLTSDAQEKSSPVWSPDSSRMAFRRHHGDGAGIDGIFEIASSGVGPAKLLFDAEPNDIVMPQSWSPDGRSLVLARVNPARGRSELWILPIGGGPATPYLVNSFRISEAAVSPNGRWLAYSSNETGISEVFVQSFPDPALERRQVSGSGGRFPRWRRDGRELFYLDGKNRVTAVPVKTESHFEAGVSAPLWETAYLPSSRQFGKIFDVTGDGQRFVVIVPRTDTAPTRLTVVATLR